MMELACLGSYYLKVCAWKTCLVHDELHLLWSDNLRSKPIQMASDF